MTVYHLIFAQPADYLNLNQRGNWRKWIEPKNAWKQAAFYSARQAINSKTMPKHLGFSVVRFSLPVKSVNVRRDPHNWTPTVKAIVDGFTDAGVWEDDDSKHLATTEPSFHAAPQTPGVLVEIDVA